MEASRRRGARPGKAWEKTSGYHRSCISLLERPSLETLFRLSGALNVAPSELILRMEALAGS
jgi:hypothetical protein